MIYLKYINVHFDTTSQEIKYSNIFILVQSNDVVTMRSSKILLEYYKIYPNKFTAPLHIYNVTPKYFFFLSMNEGFKKLYFIHELSDLLLPNTFLHLRCLGQIHFIMFLWTMDNIDALKLIKTFRVPFFSQWHIFCVISFFLYFHILYFPHPHAKHDVCKDHLI